MAIRLNDIETVFRVKADEALRTLDKAAAKADDLGKRLDETGESFKDIGAKATVAGGVITAALGAAANVADQQRQVYDGLAATMNGVGLSFDENSDRINSFLGQLQATSRFGDTDFVPAMNAILLSTGNLEQALEGTELAAKLATAGLGSIASNGRLLTQVYEGNVEVLARWLPEFRKTPDLLKAGATRAELAAKALDRLNKIADEVPPPTGLNLYQKSLGDLTEAIGDAILDGFDPLFRKLDEGNQKLAEFAQSGVGRASIIMTGAVGVIATLGGGLLVLIGQVITATATIAGVGGFTKALTGATVAAKTLGGALAAGSGLALGLIALAGYVAIVSVNLNKLSEDLEKIDDGFRKAPTLAKFRAEVFALSGTLDQLRAGTISAKEAQEEFERFGVTSIEQAEQRIGVLNRVIERLQAQAAAQRDANAATEEATGAGAEEPTDEELDAALDLELLDAEIAKLEEVRESEEALNDIREAGSGGAVLALENENSLRDDAIERMARLADQTVEIGEKVDPVVEAWKNMTKEVSKAIKPATSVTNVLAKQLPGVLDAASGIAVAFGRDLVQGTNNAAAAAEAYFKQLLIQLAEAIAKALVLKAALSFIPGGGAVGGALGGGLFGGLFQDPIADLFARFEGTRFVDLFFQGVTSQLTQTQSRISDALDESREVRESTDRPINVVVEEATPETYVEVTDRRIEPRIRQRQAQRTGTDTSVQNLA